MLIQDCSNTEFCLQTAKMSFPYSTRQKRAAMCGLAKSLPGERETQKLLPSTIVSPTTCSNTLPMGISHALAHQRHATPR